MKPIWLIEKDLFTDTEERLITLLKEKGYSVKEVKYVPFDDDLSRFERMFKPDDCVIFYGSLNLAMKLKDARLPIHIFGDRERYKCSAYYPHYGDNHINSDFKMFTFGELNERKDELFKDDEAIFIRPDSILKEFTGAVVNIFNWNEAYQLMGFYNDVVTSDLPVLVSSVKAIELEWRFVVVDGKVVSGSLYRTAEHEETLHEPCDDPKAWEFAQRMADMYCPERVFVLDVCQTNKGEYKIMEIGCFSFAGLYGNDLPVVIDKVSVVAADIHWLYMMEKL